MLVTPVAIEKYLTPSQVQGKLLYPLKHKLAQNVNVQLHSTFLFSYIIITQLLSACMKTELHLLPISEMGKFHILALNFGGWPFSITVTGYFRPKPDHSNERIYRKLIDKRLKTLPNEGSRSFLRLTTPELWKFFSRTNFAVFWIKRKHKYNILKIFSSKKQVSTISKNY